MLAFYCRPGRLSSDRHARKPLTVSELWPFGPERIAKVSAESVTKSPSGIPSFMPGI
jgi:hypothetical protein